MSQDFSTYALHMASQTVSEGSFCEWPSYIRGYHVYQTLWNPVIGKTLSLAVAPTNLHHSYAAVNVDETELLLATFPGM